MTLHEMFEKHDDEYSKFDRVPNKRSSRPDVHAFMLLDEMFVTNYDIVCWSEHDIIGLEAPTDSELYTEAIVIELSRCGVFYSSEHDSLCMFT